MTNCRRGVTLIELLVTLMILSVIASVTTLGVRRIERPIADSALATIADSLRAAVTESRAITLALSMHGTPVMATVYPDGSVIADSVFHLDPLTGRATDAR